MHIAGAIKPVQLPASVAASIAAAPAIGTTLFFERRLSGHMDREGAPLPPVLSDTDLDNTLTKIPIMPMPKKADTKNAIPCPSDLCGGTCAWPTAVVQVMTGPWNVLMRMR